MCVCLSGVLVGNKSDLSARREVQASVAQEWAQSQGMEYHETSAVSVFQYGQYSVFLFGLVRKVHRMGCFHVCLFLQKERENCDAPLLSLARAFHSLYQERCDTIQNLSPD